MISDSTYNDFATATSQVLISPSKGQLITIKGWGHKKKKKQTQDKESITITIFSGLIYSFTKSLTVVDNLWRINYLNGSEVRFICITEEDYKSIISTINAKANN